MNVEAVGQPLTHRRNTLRCYFGWVSRALQILTSKSYSGCSLLAASDAIRFSCCQSSRMRNELHQNDITNYEQPWSIQEALFSLQFVLGMEIWDTGSNIKDTFGCLTCMQVIRKVFCPFLGCCLKRGKSRHIHTGPVHYLRRYAI